ncbi:MAG: ABC transporter ATP-binding protein [Acidobacteriota bacterium]
MTTPAPAILLQGLVKRYGNLTAVKGLDLEVRPGEILGFLGLNGAGKTTTIRMLLDLLRPSGGTAAIFGHDCQSDGIHARSLIGYLPSEMGVYPHLTGREVLNVLGGLHAPATDGNPIDPHYTSELMERLELPESDLRRSVREYSTGMKRKLGIIQAFQADPRLLILDEPTEGLDPVMQEAFYQLLVDVQRRGRTVFFSSHVLSQVDRVCHRVALLRKGELVLLATVEECRHLAPRRVRLTFAADVAALETLPDGSEMVERTARVWKLRVKGPLGTLLREVASRNPGIAIEDIEVSEAKLEDVVLHLYRGDAA